MIVLNDIWNFLKELMNPESIITYGGFWFLLFVVFAETGLFIGFFLPGDSLLFTTGLLTATGIINIPIYFVISGVCIAVISGNTTGYAFGKKAGKAIFKREKSFFFKPKHLRAAKDFYDRHGGIAIILGEFLPIIRTFAPIVAGAVQLNYGKFIKYNITGAALWSNIMILSGYFLGIYIPGMKTYLPYVVIFLIVITTIPFISALIKERRLIRKKKADEKMGK
ncbi:MAG TPA: VTT domain-containing protein [Bacteroidales bacterium]|nr:VTT domain-containing protein [Bacteroidales bacterium]HPS16195.1 VTT domain-containing protein [Bacteroidales bacterium]